MPSYSETWDVTKPAGSRDLSLGDDDIREFKRAIAERLNEDHYHPQDETGVTTVGYHRKVTHVKQSGNPTPVTDAVITYCKNDGSTDELFAEDESGNVIQITDAGKLAVLGSEFFRSGDKLLSSNTNTPSGWTDQSATYTDNFIRISSGTPLTTGGSNTHTHGGSTGSYTLTTADIPAHTHGLTMYNANGAGSAGVQESSAVGGSGAQVTGSAGGGGGHSHSIASADNVPVYVQMKMYSKT